MTYSKSELFPHCAVIIVTHNSQLHIDKCMECLLAQSRIPNQIIIVDSGSQELDYLEGYAHHPLVLFYPSRNNIGYCRGNNLGLSLVADDVKYILFLNPDAFLTSTFIEIACNYMESASQTQTGAISGLLLGYDIHQNLPTGKVDSSGIFRKWYGRWYDRTQGKNYHANHFSKEECVSALCGALIFARKEALHSVLLGPNELFDNSFFMYKEDIDLSLRLKKKGWHLKLIPHLIAYHCRGWHQKRRQVSRQLRLLSAKNEVKLFARAHSPCLLYSSFKYLCVKFFDA